VWRWAPGPNKEGCDISSETPIGNSAAVTTPLIDEEPRVRDASRRFLKQLSRVARVALATDHEGRSSYLPGASPMPTCVPTSCEGGFASPSLRTGEANLDTSRCPDDSRTYSLHHPRWRQYLLCPFAQRLLKGIPRVLYMDIWCATWCLRWVDRTNSSAPCSE
jgi:hypothetical protein